MAASDPQHAMVHEAVKLKPLGSYSEHRRTPDSLLQQRTSVEVVDNSREDDSPTLVAHKGDTGDAATTRRQGGLPTDCEMDGGKGYVEDAFSDDVIRKTLLFEDSDSDDSAPELLKSNDEMPDAQSERDDFHGALEQNLALSGLDPDGEVIIDDEMDRADSLLGSGACMTENTNPTAPALDIDRRW